MMKIALALFLTGLTSTVFADQILVLSGGISPTNNHFSQYLQTKTLFDDLSARFPEASPRVMFGAGNREGEAMILADAYRTVSKDGLDVETLVPGFIKGNVAATPKNVENFFRTPKLGQMKRHENFFMFVSDHGSPYTKNDGTLDSTFTNNCIDLWGFAADADAGVVVEIDAQERCLSKDRLKIHLESQVSAGKSIFAMSQCYSGGFHQMSVTSKGGYPRANPNICGFTAVPEDTASSGCTSDVDGPSYQGYERSFTEQLTGLDVVSGTRLRPARASLKDAHEEASVEDMTKDIPLSTSDYFLWKWAEAIEGEKFTPRTQGISRADAIEAMEAVKIGGPLAVNDPHYSSKNSNFQRVKNRIAALNPEIADKLDGNLNDLKQAVIKAAQAVDDADDALQITSNSGEQLAALLLRQWGEHVRSGKSNLSPADRALELSIFASQNDQLPLLHMSVKGVTDPDFASSISKYKSVRLQLAKEWAQKSKRKDLNTLPPRVNRFIRKIKELTTAHDNAEKVHGRLRRIMIYRQVLGAWAALEKMKDQQALDDLKGLIDCEGTSL